MMITTLLAALTTGISLSYDPLKISSGPTPEPVLLTLKDPARNREVPIRIYLPAGSEQQEVVLFSHGLGGSRMNNSYLGEHFAARGYVVVFMQHPGSDESVWKGVRLGQRMSAMKKAASGENFKLRVDDVHFVIDELTKLNKSDAKFKNRFNLERVGMSGHSFGAVTTQAVSGQTVMGRQTGSLDSRIDAAIAYSPSPAAAGTPEGSFGKVSLPWLLMTGTEDESPISDMSPEDRLKVYPALPPGDKYEVVLYKGAHSAFSERSLPTDKHKQNPNHHKVILALSTAFWDSYLKQIPTAKSWLKGSGPRSVMEKNDTWKSK